MLLIFASPNAPLSRISRFRCLKCERGAPLSRISRFRCLKYERGAHFCVSKHHNIITSHHDIITTSLHRNRQSDAPVTSSQLHNLMHPSVCLNLWVQNHAHARRFANPISGQVASQCQMHMSLRSLLDVGTLRKANYMTLCSLLY